MGIYRTQQNNSKMENDIHVYLSHLHHVFHLLPLPLPFSPAHLRVICSVPLCRLRNADWDYVVLLCTMSLQIVWAWATTEPPSRSISNAFLYSWSDTTVALYTTATHIVVLLKIKVGPRQNFIEQQIILFVWPWSAYIILVFIVSYHGNFISFFWKVATSYHCPVKIRNCP
jgi:hypothetical protein